MPNYRIILNNDGRTAPDTFFSGEVISGIIRLESSSTQKFNYISIKFEGKAQVSKKFKQQNIKKNYFKNYYFVFKVSFFHIFYEILWI
jgi:hypothetical protein